MSIEGFFKDFTARLSECTGEDVGPYEGVSALYSEFFSLVFRGKPSRIHGCDGYWKLPESITNGTPACMLAEYKFGRNLKSKLELSKVLAQCVYYIHKFIESGEAVPKVVCVADENESVFLSGEVLWRIAGKSTDFSLSPSNAASDESLLKSLYASSYIENLFVFDMDSTCDLEGMLRTVANIASAGEDDVLVEVTAHNIDKIWNCFREIVFGKGAADGANERVSVFVHYITNHDDFIVDDAKGRFSLNGKAYKIADPKQFKAFRRHFGYVRSVKQKERLRATCDRFIEDMNRRKKGEFYTPTAFVDYAHKMIEREFGENWKEEYVVWDCAWGTGNLTRDYEFAELYCSTLEQAELDIAKGVNPEAVKFQYDFLNDDFEKLPEGLQKAFKEGRKILFLINPPYGTAQAGGCKGANKIGVSNTLVNKAMLKDNVGKSAQNLYTQFLYRIAKMQEKFEVEISIASFTKVKFLTGGSFKLFRLYFFDRFNYRNGFKFDSRHFSDTSAGWPVFFSLWKTGKTTFNEFPCSLLDKSNSGDVVQVGSDVVYNADDHKQCSEWIREGVAGLKGEDAPQMKSALAWREDGQLRGSLVNGALGYVMNSGNNVGENPQGSALYTSCPAKGLGCSIFPVNYERVVANFAARRLISPNWMNDEKEYLVPDESHEKYKEFVNDATVYSLIENTQQSSLRNIAYKGKLWDIKNEFFWMDRDEIMNLADEAGFEELYNDAKKSSGRFVHGKLQELDLSPEASAVLQKASEIVRKSFEYRKGVHDLHPEYHLNAWDAGWYQIKKLVAELPHMKADMDEFKALFKALADKMRPMVYELGFLKK